MFTKEARLYFAAYVIEGYGSALLIMMKRPAHMRASNHTQTLNLYARIVARAARHIENNSDKDN